MLKDITVGQFYPADSKIHKLDAGVKLIAALIFMISIFLVDKFIVYGGIVVVLIAVIMASKIPVKYILKGIKPLRWIILFTVIINMFFVPGNAIWSFGFMRITEEGIHQALFMSIRLTLLIIGTSVLTLTTSPIALTDGIERVLSPVKKLGFPVHELAMMMTIALRFIPTLLDETDKIMKAQMSRGADFESGNIMSRAKNLVPLLVPLFISAFRRADELSMAMDARCYRGGDNRTKMKEAVIGKPEYISILMLILYTGAIIAMRFINIGV